MSSNPLISILIPAYNHEKYIGQTVDSIVRQTYPRIELLVHDDNSADKTWECLQQLRQQYNNRFIRFEISTAKNQGTCRTLNQLVSAARGEYIYLIASDDLMEPGALEKQVHFLQTHPDFVLVAGNNRFIDQNGQTCGWDEHGNIRYDPSQIKYGTFADFLQTTSKVDFSGPEFGSYAQLYRGNHIPNGYLFRKSALEKAGFFTPQAPLEDYWLMLQLAKQGKMKFLNEILFSYRQHPGNTIKNKEKMNQIEHQTRQYEQNLLEELNRKGQLSQELQQILKNGVLIQSKKFLGFRLSKYRRYPQRITRLTFMGRIIYTRTKYF